MNITELDSFDLTDAIRFHEELNPAIWDDEHMKPEVRKTLLKIAEDFKQFLGVSDLELVDITLSGSNAGYTYASKSDIDLHLVADLPNADISKVYRELFDAKKYQYNELHNYKIGGYDVELYVQNAKDEHTSQGIYSVLNDKWISIPTQQRAKVDDLSTKSKYETLLARAKAAIKSKNYKAISVLIDKLRMMRRVGLESGGELSPENLAYKMLRTNGILDDLYDAKFSSKSAELSLEDKSPEEYGWVGDASEGKMLDVRTPSVGAIARKHGAPVDAIRAQLAKGIKVEQEHTTDLAAAKEIALDHLNEIPDYYTKLDQMEKGFLPVTESRQDASTAAAQFRAYIKNDFPGITVDLYGSTFGGLTIGKIEVPKPLRKAGLATKIMKDICQMADQNGLQVSLTPTDEFGSSKNRLITFYSRFGFVVNKGKHKDYTISELMYRPTKKKVLGKIYEGGVGRITKQNQTVDVGPDEIKKQAAKFGNKVSKDGVPVMKLQSSGKVGDRREMPSYPIRDYPVFCANGSIDGLASSERHWAITEGTIVPVDQDIVAFLSDLTSLSKFEVGKTHLVVLLSVSGKRINLDWPVGFMTFLGRRVDHDIEVVILRDGDGREITYPNYYQRAGGFWVPFLFRSEDNYNKFRMVLSLKFSVDLPEMDFTDL